MPLVLNAAEQFPEYYHPKFSVLSYSQHDDDMDSHVIDTSDSGVNKQA